MKELVFEKDNRPLVGIDLGTTNCVVTVARKGILPSIVQMDDNGKKTMPSCVLWNGGDSFTVGEEAYRLRYQSNAVYSAKRLMGQNRVIKLTHPDTGETRDITPLEVSSLILKELCERTAKYYGSVSDVIITVPAYFNQNQIEDTSEAAKRIGLNVVHILKEPTSSAYIYSGIAKTSGNILIYDLGGGTFDVTLMSFLKISDIEEKQKSYLSSNYGCLQDEENEVYISDVLGTWGDMFLGGDDVDAIFADKVMKKNGITLNTVDYNKLLLACERFKKSNLSGQTITIGGNSVSMSSGELSEAFDEIFKRTLDLMQEVGEVDTIVLVGGSTKSNQIRKRISEAFPNSEICCDLDPDLAVGLGAGAVIKDVLSDNKLPFRDVLPMGIGIGMFDNTVQYCIDRNTPIPFSTVRTFYTSKDNQSFIRVPVYQGVNTTVDDCIFLGDAIIENIPLRKAGDVSVTIRFVLDNNGVLNVISTADGVETPVKLTIDHIYSAEEKKAMDTQKSYGDFKPQDDFEYGLAALVLDNPKAMELLLRRREATTDEERNDIEMQFMEFLM